jgi:hypothetical protein
MKNAEVKKSIKTSFRANTWSGSLPKLNERRWFLMLFIQDGLYKTSIAIHEKTF